MQFQCVNSRGYFLIVRKLATDNLRHLFVQCWFVLIMFWAGGWPVLSSLTQASISPPVPKFGFWSLMGTWGLIIIGIIGEGVPVFLIKVNNSILRSLRTIELTLVMLRRLGLVSHLQSSRLSWLDTHTATQPTTHSLVGSSLLSTTNKKYSPNITWRIFSLCPEESPRLWRFQITWKLLIKLCRQVCWDKETILTIS